eukprot:12899213-Prorocentrum_lima.AAC.1
MEERPAEAPEEPEPFIDHRGRWWRSSPTTDRRRWTDRESKRTRGQHGGEHHHYLRGARQGDRNT